MSTPLSPAAQAIWDAWNDAYEAQGPLEGMDQPLAAAFRAVADQIDAVNVPDHIRGDAYWSYRNGRAAAKEHLIAIADELEGFNV
jgi:hypothetical protein